MLQQDRCAVFTYMLCTPFVATRRDIYENMSAFLWNENVIASIPIGQDSQMTPANSVTRTSKMYPSSFIIINIRLPTTDQAVALGPCDLDMSPAILPIRSGRTISAG